MTASDLAAAVRPIADALDVAYYVSGSVQSSAHGIARTSVDADIVAALEARHDRARLTPELALRSEPWRAYGSRARRGDSVLKYPVTVFHSKGISIAGIGSASASAK